jgi:hypothetical protein
VISSNAWCISASSLFSNWSLYACTFSPKHDKWWFIFVVLCRSSKRK